MLPPIDELVARAYRAVNERDLDAYLATVHPEVEFRSLIAEAEDRDYRGHAGARHYWQTVVEAFAQLR
jgi:ketosteroid isomerase-like protein